ncbi:MAG: hypothetical protein ACI9MR_004922, partial [Myxococcota bacterium]
GKKFKKCHEGKLDELAALTAKKGGSGKVAHL